MLLRARAGQAAATGRKSRADHRGPPPGWPAGPCGSVGTERTCDGLRDCVPAPDHLHGRGIVSRGQEDFCRRHLTGRLRTGTRRVRRQTNGEASRPASDALGHDARPRRMAYGLTDDGAMLVTSGL